MHRYSNRGFLKPIIRLSCLALIGAGWLLLTACQPTGGARLATPDSRLTATRQAQATLTAAAYQTAVADVTATVQAASEALAAMTRTAPGALQPSPSPGSAPTPTETGVATPGSIMPVITYFGCDPCSIEPGGASTLSWQVENAEVVTLDDQGVVAPGSRTVRPDQTTRYRLVAVNAHGRSEQSLTVEVRGLPIIHFFTCLPCQIRKGEVATLSWDLSGASAAYLDDYGVPAPGNVQVAPDKTTTYRLTAVSPRGSVERLVTVTVIEGGDADTVTRALTEAGYRVRSVGYLPMESGGSTISVVMAALEPRLTGSQAAADQYFWGLLTLLDNYPGERLSVGLYDGLRYTTFVTVHPSDLEDLLRGALDGYTFWQSVAWNTWDDWSGRWLPHPELSFGRQDFSGAGFAKPRVR